MAVIAKLSTQKQKGFLEQCDKVKYDLLQQEYLSGTDLLKKKMGMIPTENSHIFKRNGRTLVHNTSKDACGYVFQHIEKEQVKDDSSYQTSVCVQQKQIKLIQSIATMCQGSTGAPGVDNRQAVYCYRSCLV